jgi:hypothetical protein
MSAGMGVKVSKHVEDLHTASIEMNRKIDISPTAIPSHPMPLSVAVHALFDEGNEALWCLRNR